MPKSTAYQHFLTVVAILASILLNNSYMYAQNWQLAKEKNGIKVFKQVNDTGTIRSYRVEANIESNQEDLVKVLLSVDKYNEWITGMDEVKVLSKHGSENQHKVEYYSLTKMPWPVWDRDMVGVINSEKNGDGYVISNQSLNKSVKIPNKTTRVKNFKENYILRPLDTANTQIELEGYFDIQGNLPNWLIDIFLVEGPIHTISALKEKVAKK